ncbi:MAG: Hsp20/alpha crystallin family protein [Acidobacteriota bacterium]
MTGTGLAPKKMMREMTALDPFRIFQNRMSRFFDEDFPFAIPEETLSLKTWMPSCDIYETENEIVVKAELPGAKKEDVKVNIENNILTLSGERKFEEETRKENYVRVERKYGEFLRSFTLPMTVDANKVVADFKDGLLTITLPKKEEAKPKPIEITVK